MIWRFDFGGGLVEKFQLFYFEIIRFDTISFWALSSCDPLTFMLLDPWAERE